MADEEVDPLVARLEEFAEKNPRAYRTRVGLLAVLGYGYIWMMLVLVLAFIGGMVWLAVSRHTVNGLFLRVGMFLVIPAIAIIRSLWVHFPHPEGVPLTREQAPVLFELLDELTNALEGPRVHHVLLNSGFNAAVAQRPRLGVLGWQENYLLLGLPLLQALPPEQFRAVIAHELGHLSGNHSRFGGWIYRVAATWRQIEANFAKQGNRGSWLFEEFFDLYWPYFNAYSFVLRRADEYVADLCAAQLTSVQTASSALINVHVKGHFLEAQFWPGIFHKASYEPAPPGQTFSNLTRAFRDDIAPEDARDWVTRALGEAASDIDTHPSLIQRLRALGYVSEISGSTVDGTEASRSVAAPLDESALSALLNHALQDLNAEDNAASFYLTANAEKLARAFDEIWRQNHSGSWQQRHTSTAGARAALRDIEDKAVAVQNESATPGEVLSEEDMWNRARFTAEIGDRPAAVKLFRELLMAHPGHVPALFALGRFLLQMGDLEGVKFLDEAMAKEPQETLKTCMFIADYLKALNHSAESNEYRKRAESFHEKMQQSQRERTEVTPQDTFLAPELGEEELEKVCAAVQTQELVGEAFLVRKKVQHFPEDPCYVLAVVLRPSVAKLLSAQDNAAVVDAIGPHLPGTAVSFLFILTDNTKALGEAIRQVEGSRIYCHPETE